MKKFFQILFLFTYTFLLILTTLHYHTIGYYNYNSFTISDEHACDSLVCDVCLIAHTQESYTSNHFFISSDIVDKLFCLNDQIYYYSNLFVDLTRAPPTNKI